MKLYLRTHGGPKVVTVSYERGSPVQGQVCTFQNVRTHPSKCILGRSCAMNPKRDPKAKMLYLQSFLRKGVSLDYVGLN